MRHRLSLIAAILGLMVIACGGDGGTTDSTGANDPGTTAGGGGGAGVHAAETELGSILVDPDGFTLYIFTSDSDGTSTCNEGCADLWPPVAADTAIGSGLDSSIFASTTRDDGTEQLTVNGMPLYRYTPDASPGDVTGQGFGGVWFVVDPAGAMIEAAADTATVDYGY